MFIHLRAHSDYSLLESSITIEKLISLCVRHNMPAVALTDNGNLFGSLEFAECARAAGVQPIIGCILTLHHRGKFFPIVLLVKNQQGYVNLVNLVGQSFKNRIEQQKCISLIDLELRCEGLIGLLHDKTLLEFLRNQESELLIKIIDIFKNNLFIELQRYEKTTTAKEVIDFAYQQNVPLVATNDIFFAERDDFEANDALICIADGTYVLEDDRRKITHDHYFKSPKEMINLFADIPEAIANTVLIAKKCAFMPEARNPILPHFPCSEGKTEAEELREQALLGLEAHIVTFNVEQKQEYYNRLNYELEIIISMNYSGYFLIVSDFIRWSKKNNVPVGPGRGSGAGSLVAWSLDITGLDPIKFGLIFERFLNPERISMPDFDIDFCQDKREKVIEYIKDKYGYVAQIITFGKLQARAVLRDVGRVLQMPYNQVDRICKMIPHNPINPITLSEAIKLDKNLQQERDNDQNISKLFNISLKLEGLNRHASTHAAGVVICDRPLEELIPICYEPVSSLPITQYNMKYVEKAGLVKFDFLGLKTLTLIDQICTLIRANGLDIDLDSIAIDDEKTYKMLSQGDTIGVFQLESSGMREVLCKLKPDHIEDIIALISLYRPGPMDNINTYINRKHGLEEADYIDPMLESVLKETFGVIIYQEQVMEIARIMAGYSLGSADILRRAMGKKIKKEMDKQRETFIAGAVKNRVSAKKASHVFDLVAKFAGYGFNKSHAAAYALISFQTAFLKANYPLEFFTASLNLDINDKDKLNNFCYTIKDHKIKILPPDINRSKVYFSIEDNAIRYGLGALKNVGLSSAQDLISMMVNDYSDIQDVIKNISAKTLNKKNLEGLIRAGAFDSIHSNRRQLFESIDLILTSVNNNHLNSTQTALFSTDHFVQLAEIEDWSYEQRLQAEYSALGFYLTDHPLSKYKQIFEIMNISFFNENSKKQNIVGTISSINIRSSSRGKFAILTISNPQNVLDVAFYDAEIMTKSKHLFIIGNSVMIQVERAVSQSRIIGRAMCALEDVCALLIKKIIVHVSDSSNIRLLSKFLNREGSVMVAIRVFCALNEAIIDLPKSYYIDLHILTIFLNYQWITAIKILWKENDFFPC